MPFAENTFSNFTDVFSTKEYFNNDVYPLLGIEFPSQGNFSPRSHCFVRNSTTMNSRKRKLNFRATKVQSTLRNLSGVSKTADKESLEVIKLSLLRNPTPKPV
jgi:hypothetical protein